MKTEFNNIFDKIDHHRNTPTYKDEEIAFQNNITCGYKPELNCYFCYRKNQDGKVASVVYITASYREHAENAKTLEQTVINYLETKDGMQATFKTTGIDEAALIEREEPLTS